MPLLSRATWLRIQQKLNQENAANPPAVGPNVVTTWNPVLVRANSATAIGGSAEGDQCYDASVLLINSLVDDQEIGADVWLTVLDAAGVASAPDEGRVYLGLYAGRFDPGDDSRSRVFASPIGASTSGAGSACALAVLNPTDCIKITNSFDDSTVYGTNTGAGVWTSDDDIDYPGGSGPLVMTYAAGEITVTVDGMEMIPCGNGCWSGGPLTGHADDTEGDEACDGETFTVCISCSECIATSACIASFCPDGVPKNVVGTISNKTGGCTCLPDTTPTLEYDGTSAWYDPALTPYLCGDNVVTFGCAMVPPATWTFDWNRLPGCATNPSVSFVSVSCDPFELVLDITGLSSAGTCPCAGTFRITFTAA